MAVAAAVLEASSDARAAEDDELLAVIKLFLSDAACEVVSLRVEVVLLVVSSFSFSCSCGRSSLGSLVSSLSMSMFVLSLSLCGFILHVVDNRWRWRGASVL